MASPATKSLAEGVIVTPTIRVLRQLGRGGMGTIWLAEHAGLRTRVVVKFMDTVLATNPESVARFSREAAAAATVRSPHVVQIFDHGVSDRGQPFIVMELLEGKDLGDHLGDVGRMPLKQVSLLVTQTAKALARAHAHGIVHRDIKPENIFLCDVGAGDVFVKLLDFGLAKRKQEDELTSETRTGATMGTPFYMSPEQIVNPKHADPRSDLWALAVVAYECLTGYRPFDGETVGAIAVALHSAKRPTATERTPSLPVQIDEWFARAFATRPEDRFPDAKSMAAAFREIATTVPHVDVPLSTGERRKSSRRRKVVTPAPDPPSLAFEPAMLSTEHDDRRQRLIPVFAGLAALAGMLVVIVATRREPVATAAPAPPAIVEAPRIAPTPEPTIVPVLAPAPSPVAVASTTAIAPPRPKPVVKAPPVAPATKPETSVAVAPKPTPITAVSAAVKKKYVDIQ